MRGRIGELDVALGNVAMMLTAGVDVTAADATAAAHRRQAQTVMYVAIDGQLAGLVAVADPVKAGAREALDALRAEGLRIVMLTGDARETASAVGAGLGFAASDIHAECFPRRSAT